MKKQLLILTAALAASAIVLAQGVTVNQHANQGPHLYPRWMADGVPLPPPTQPPPKLQVADGVPLPPPTQPPPKASTALTADGVPLPPPTQPPPKMDVADGVPLPPPTQPPPKFALA